jgi:hypothetical protein
MKRRTLAPLICVSLSLSSHAKMSPESEDRARGQSVAVQAFAFFRLIVNSFLHNHDHHEPDYHDNCTCTTHHPPTSLPLTGSERAQSTSSQHHQARKTEAVVYENNSITRSRRSTSATRLSKSSHVSIYLLRVFAPCCFLWSSAPTAI